MVDRNVCVTAIVVEVISGSITSLIVTAVTTFDFDIDPTVIESSASWNSCAEPDARSSLRHFPG